MARSSTRLAEDGQLVVGDPVGGEDHQVARQLAGLARVEVGELDRLHPGSPVDGGQPGAGLERRAEAQRARRPGTRRGTGGAGCSVIIATARAPPWASVSSAEKLTCSAPTTTARRPGTSPRR